MGNRDDIDEMSSGNHRKQSDVLDIYGLVAKTNRVFINLALVKPFGLTLIVAAAHGLPMVATKNRGLVSIHGALHNGVLVDPHDQWAIAKELPKPIRHPQWKKKKVKEVVTGEGTYGALPLSLIVNSPFSTIAGSNVLLLPANLCCYFSFEKIQAATKGFNE
ncbi:hypothetical protein ZIOFF_056273 [Zingiber officinale]|uniref:sucrose-phosphate synthase n=1 Tax=Zingiber officinale TaxID=94328 RepID=A0A8J5KFA1_ZINOF|nr:hypothetical protein ZIOFF_056273 [Zingiber officinale]